MSPTRIHHIRQQGYFELSDRQIRLLAWGNRTSFIMSTLVLAAGVGLSSIEILAAQILSSAYQTEKLLQKIIKLLKQPDEREIAKLPP